jgi:transposase InsO family protein
MQVIRISYGVKGFAILYNDGLKYRMLTEKAKHKVKVIVFWEKHGLEAALDAFPHKRSTLYNWKRILAENNGRLESLNEKKTSPNNKRKRIVDERIEKFIIDLRIAHPRTGKEKLKPLLDKYCKEQGIKSISISTIGRIVLDLKKKNKLPTQKKLSYYARSDSFSERIKTKRKKIRRKDYQPEYAGDLVQVDTIVKFINGIKRYIVTAIDLKSEFGFAYAYTNHSSASTADFFQKFQSVAPFTIRRIQTDNGSEFDFLFAEYAEKQNIIHFHNYPKCPKMNAVVERFNRTIQEDFIDWRREALSKSIDKFNADLIEWLLWYNTERPHHTLRQIPPMQYIVNNLILDAQNSKMICTHTRAFFC